MSYTRVGYNISSQFGMPLYGITGIPPFTGNQFWVDETNGNDGNTGGPQDPFATLTQALSLCTANNDDVVFLVGTLHATATVAWSKNRTHLIGLSGLGAASKALISVSSVAATTGAFSPLVNVTASGCLFKNINTLSGINQAATQVCWAEAGGQNTYEGCNFNQVGHATAAAQAGNRALTLASTNNYFSDCVIGGDSVIRATGTNISMEMLDGSGSSTFKGCVFPIYTSVAANTFVKTSSTALSGYFVFDGCSFINDVNNTSGTTMTVGFTFATASLSLVLLTPTTTVVGVTNNVAAGGAVWFSTPASAAATGNQAIIGT